MNVKSNQYVRAYAFGVVMELLVGRLVSFVPLCG